MSNKIKLNTGFVTGGVAVPTEDMVIEFEKTTVNFIPRYEEISKNPLKKLISFIRSSMIYFKQDINFNKEEYSTSTISTIPYYDDTPNWIFISKLYFKIIKNNIKQVSNNKKEVKISINKLFKSIVLPFKNIKEYIRLLYKEYKNEL